MVLVQFKWEFDAVEFGLDVTAHPIGFSLVWFAQSIPWVQFRFSLVPQPFSRLLLRDLYQLQSFSCIFGFQKSFVVV
jgi:hypothetical protein